ncbi:MAG TPA: hypothetical protein VEQ10_20910, partial [Vicinamibacteria bacterium]|nr:hypothetical protein [Vicinamibacteria bacterium]
MRSSILVVSATVALVFSTKAWAQEKVPETRAEVVRLDVVVTERDGKLVRELTREDFHLLEDGKPQPLTNFLAVTRAAHTAQVPTPAAPAQPASPGRSVVV